MYNLGKPFFNGFIPLHLPLSVGFLHVSSSYPFSPNSMETLKNQRLQKKDVI